MTQRNMKYEKLTTSYEFPVTSFCLDRKMVKAYLDATEDNNRLYAEQQIIPPMAIAALSMAAMSTGLVLPPGTIHVSQELEFLDTVNINEILTSHARVNRKMERGKFNMLTIGINVLNQRKTTVLAGETSFILPAVAMEGK